jgi:hypothetical protein
VTVVGKKPRGRNGVVRHGVTPCSKCKYCFYRQYIAA